MNLLQRHPRGMALAAAGARVAGTGFRGGQYIKDAPAASHDGMVVEHPSGRGRRNDPAGFHDFDGIGPNGRHGSKKKALPEQGFWML